MCKGAFEGQYVHSSGGTGDQVYLTCFLGQARNLQVNERSLGKVVTKGIRTICRAPEIWEGTSFLEKSRSYKY